MSLPPLKPVNLSQKIARQLARKQAAQSHKNNSLWAGLGLMGIVGWSVVVPTLLGALLGRWLDANYPNEHSWTLALLIAGLTLGCFKAGYWVSKEHKNMHQIPPTPQEDKHHG